MGQMKRAEIVVTAESDWGLERGANYAWRELEKNNLHGEFRIDNHNIHVRWRIQNVNMDAPPPPSILDVPPPASMPDISAMDIEEARGVVGVASSQDELDQLEALEKGGERVPGGRAGVLKYIEKVRKDVAAREEALKAKEAASDASEDLQGVHDGSENTEKTSEGVSLASKDTKKGAKKS